MAFSLNVPTEFGIPATYWRVGEYHEIFGVSGVVVVFGFADMAATDTSSPLATRVFEILGEQYSPSMDRAAIYAIAKLRPEFEGAEDA